MRGFLTQLTTRFLLLIAIVSLSLAAIVSTSARRDQEQSNQQRPRKVGTNQNAGAPPANQKPTNPSEEVDEGDVVRVETQLVTVPAVVIDREGHPISTLRLENFALLEDGRAQQLTNFATTEAPFEI